jgi:hypothetical protein
MTLPATTPTIQQDTSFMKVSPKNTRHEEGQHRHKEPELLQEGGNPSPSQPGLRAPTRQQAKPFFSFKKVNIISGLDAHSLRVS